MLFMRGRWPDRRRSCGGWIANGADRGRVGHGFSLGLRRSLGRCLNSTRHLLFRSADVSCPTPLRINLTDEGKWIGDGLKVEAPDANASPQSKEGNDSLSKVF